MNYKDEMRKLINIVKQKSLSAPLQSSLNYMQMLTTAVKDLNDRLAIRVLKGNEHINKAKQSVKTKRQKLIPSITPSTQTQQNTKQTTPSTSKPVTKTGTKQMDYNKAKANFVAKQRTLRTIPT